MVDLSHTIPVLMENRHTQKDEIEWGGIGL